MPQKNWQDDDTNNRTMPTTAKHQQHQANWENSWLKLLTLQQQLQSYVALSKAIMPSPRKHKNQGQRSVASEAGEKTNKWMDVMVTVTESLVLCRLLGDRRRITKQSSACFSVSAGNNWNRTVFSWRRKVLLDHSSLTNCLFQPFWNYNLNCCIKNVQVAHTRLLSVGFRSWSWFLAVSLQVTWVIKPAEGGHYFPPGNP